MVRTCFALLVALIAPSTVSTAAVFYSDDRVGVSSREGSLFSPIGIVYRSKRDKYSTGFLIDDCNVLTVKHAVDDVAPAIGRKLYFSVGPGTIRGKWTSQGVVIASGEFNIQESGHEPGMGRDRDWLLLKLDDCLGKRFGHIALDLAGNAPGDPRQFESAGYPIDRPLSYPTLDPRCAIRASLNRVVLHDCASRPGSSGSPIFRRVIREGRIQLEVYAMHSAGVPDRGVRPFDFAYSSIAIPIGSILPALAKQLSAKNSSERLVAISYR